MKLTWNVLSSFIDDNLYKIVTRNFKIIKYNFGYKTPNCLKIIKNGRLGCNPSYASFDLGMNIEINLKRIIILVRKLQLKIMKYNFEYKTQNCLNIIKNCESLRHFFNRRCNRIDLKFTSMCTREDNYTRHFDTHANWRCEDSSLIIYIIKVIQSFTYYHNFWH